MPVTDALLEHIISNFRSRWPSVFELSFAADLRTSQNRGAEVVHQNAILVVALSSDMLPRETSIVIGGRFLSFCVR